MKCLPREISVALISLGQSLFHRGGAYLSVAEPILSGRSEFNQGNKPNKLNKPNRLNKPNKLNEPKSPALEIKQPPPPDELPDELAAAIPVAPLVKALLTAWAAEK